MSVSVEFDHFVGFNTIPNGIIFHPNGQNYLFSAGANAVIGDLMNPHHQDFLKKHNDFITAIAISPDGNYIATGQKGENSDIVVWDFNTRQIIYIFEEHDFEIKSLSFSHDNKMLASIGNSEDHKLLIWDLSNGCIVAACPKIPLGTNCVSFVGFVKNIKRRNTDHYLLCTAGIEGFMLWDLDPYSGELEGMKIESAGRGNITRDIRAITYSDDKEYLYGATTSGDFLIVGLKQGRILKAVQATKMGLGAMLGYENGIVIGCDDSTIKFFDINYEFKSEVKLDGSITGLSFSPDRLEVLVSTVIGTVVRLNIETKQYIIISESHTQQVIAVAFRAGRSDQFATASVDGTIRVWDMAEYSVIVTAVARRDQERGVTPLCIAFSDVLLSGWSDGRVLAHSAETGANQWFIENAHPGGVTAMCLSHNRRFILTGGPSGEVRLWELRSRDLISHLKEHVQKVTSLALFNDDTIALSASRDRCILRWDLKSERRTYCHMQRMGGINDVILSKDESHIITVGQEKKIVYWNNSESESKHSMFLNGEQDEGRSLSLSHNGKYIATGGTAGILRLWDYKTGQQICEVIGHSGAINSCAFSPDDKQIISVGDDGAIFVWCVFNNEDNIIHK